MAEVQRERSSGHELRGLSGKLHAVHGILSLLTGGAWLPVWCLHWLYRRFGGRVVALTLSALLLATVGLGYVSYQWYESLPEEEKARLEAERVAWRAQREAQEAIERAQKEEEKAKRRAERKRRREELAQLEAAKARHKLCKDSAIDAFVMSQTFVKRRLKSPSTAEFPMITDPAVRVRPADECGYQVVAYVDSQNGFGATVRTPYLAYVSPTHGGEEWVLDSLTIE